LLFKGFVPPDTGVTIKCGGIKCLKSTNTVVYFDWKEVIYIYVCRKCCTQFMLPMEKSVIFTGACGNEIIPSINRSFVYKAKEGGHVRMRTYIEMQEHNLILRMDSVFKWCQSLPGYTYIHTVTLLL
jgi:hypothetical protein